MQASVYYLAKQGKELTHCAWARSVMTALCLLQVCKMLNDDLPDRESDALQGVAPAYD